MASTDEEPYCKSWTDSIEKAAGPITKCFLIETFRTCNVFDREVTKGEMGAALGAIAINSPLVSQGLYEVAGKYAPMAAMALTFATTYLIEQSLKEPDELERTRSEAMILAALGFCLNNQDKIFDLGSKFITQLQSTLTASISSKDRTLSTC